MWAQAAHGISSTQVARALPVAIEIVKWIEGSESRVCTYTAIQLKTTPLLLRWLRD